MLSDEWLSRYGLLENSNASVTRTRTGTGTWTTGVTAIALCTLCSRANKLYCTIRHTHKFHASHSTSILTKQQHFIITFTPEVTIFLKEKTLVFIIEEKDSG